MGAVGPLVDVTVSQHHLILGVSVLYGANLNRR
jgi:hypothetical protein